MESGIITRSVTKEIKWDCAHRLSKDYPGKCRWVHGHSWVAFVTISGTKLDKFDFVQDFADLKPIRAWIDNHWDHATLVWNQDHALLDWLIENKQKFYSFPSNPTSEHLAEYLYSKSNELMGATLNDGCKVTKVEIKETCTSCASYGVIS